jgi:hypothetical protein
VTAATSREQQVWARCEPVVSLALDVSEDQTTYGYHTCWWRELDPERDLTTEAWDGEDRLFAMVTKTYYGIVVDGAEIVEEQTEYLICGNTHDPGGTEMKSWYQYRTVEDGPGMNSGDAHLQNLARSAWLAGVAEWNVHVATVEDDSWAQLDDGN